DAGGLCAPRYLPIGRGLAKCHNAPVLQSLAAGAIEAGTPADGRRRYGKETMPYQTIEVRKSTPNIGAEIAAIDLSKPLSNQQFQEVHDALVAHQVIFFRDQTLSPERHKELGLRFGKLHVHPAAPGMSAEHPEIFAIKADETSKHVAGEDWHSDV